MGTIAEVMDEHIPRLHGRNQNPLNRHNPQQVLHDLLRLNNGVLLNPLYRIPLLHLLLSTLLRVRDEPLDRFDVREGDHADEDRDGRG